MLYKKFDREQILREFFRLSAMLTMRFELADADNRDQRDVIYSAASEIRDKKEPSEIRHILKDKIREDTPNNTEIRENLKQAKMNMGVWKYRTRLMLVSIEESRDSSKTININNLHIDHIAPRRAFSKDEYYQRRQKHKKEGFSDRCGKIGNLALLTPQEHRELKESSFDDKMQTYKNSSISTTRGIAREFDNWGDNAIERRTELMTEGLLNCWSLP
jgi:ribonuclease BN (tRNA processing enzyme)